MDAYQCDFLLLFQALGTYKQRLLLSLCQLTISSSTYNFMLSCIAFWVIFLLFVQNFTYQVWTKLSSLLVPHKYISILLILLSPLSEMYIYLAKLFICPRNLAWPSVQLKCHLPCETNSYCIRFKLVSFCFTSLYFHLSWCSPLSLYLSLYIVILLS